MPTGYNRRLSGVMCEWRACNWRKWQGKTFAQALPLMTWDNFYWLLSQLSRRSGRKNPDLAYLLGARDALGRVEVPTDRLIQNYGGTSSPVMRYLTPEERIKAISNTIAPKKLRALLGVR